MKKTIEYLKETGKLDDILKMIRNGLTKGGFDLLVTCMVDSDDNLEDKWFDDIHRHGLDNLWDHCQCELKEQDAVEALKDVDPDALFKKATGHVPDPKDEQSVEDWIKDITLTLCEAIVKDLRKDEE